MSLFFDDFAVGQSFASGGRTVTEAEVIQFAHAYDPQHLHLDRPRAEAGPFGGLIASGFQTLSLAWWLFLQSGPVQDSMWVGAGIDELRWRRPVRPGDTLRAQAVVVEKSPSSAPDRGRLTFAHTVTNQDGAVVLTYRTLHVVRRKAPDPA